MHFYRISKYNPKNRNINGNYKPVDWTSFSDIGKIFLEKKLTFQEYKRVEDLYIEFILLAMMETNTVYLEVNDLEKYGSKSDILNLSSKSRILYEKFDNNLLVDVDSIPILLQLQLRDLIWIKLSSENLKIHFGYDYYMYIISKEKISFASEIAFKNTFYIEEGVKSPYE